MKPLWIPLSLLMKLTRYSEFFKNFIDLLGILYSEHFEKWISFRLPLDTISWDTLYNLQPNK